MNASAHHVSCPSNVSCSLHVSCYSCVSCPCVLCASHFVSAACFLYNPYFTSITFRVHVYRVHRVLHALHGHHVLCAKVFQVPCLFRVQSMFSRPYRFTCITFLVRHVLRATHILCVTYVSCPSRFTCITFPVHNVCMHRLFRIHHILHALHNLCATHQRLQLFDHTFVC